jgi:hypothetical protein
MPIINIGEFTPFLSWSGYSASQTTLAFLLFLKKKIFPNWIWRK